MARERNILERAVHSISEQAANTSKIVDEAIEAGLPADHPVTVTAKMLRLELLQVKADLERELATWVLDCKDCGMDVQHLHLHRLALASGVPHPPDSGSTTERGPLPPLGL